MIQRRQEHAILCVIQFYDKVIPNLCWQEISVSCNIALAVCKLNSVHTPHQKEGYRLGFCSYQVNLALQETRLIHVAVSMLHKGSQSCMGDQEISLVSRFLK